MVELDSVEPGRRVRGRYLIDVPEAQQLINHRHVAADAGSITLPVSFGHCVALRSTICHVLIGIP